MTDSHRGRCDPAGVEWRKMAEPQVDQYDTAIALQFLRDAGIRRTPVGDAQSLFDGEVAIDNDPFAAFPPSCVPAPLDNPHLEQACDMLRLWPPVFTQFQGLIDRISAFIDVESGGGITHRSGSDEPGRVAVTINNPVTLAEGLVHELAHHKLITIGVRIDSAERIILNNDKPLYKSPVRYDCLRPMTAILHAQYALLYIAGLHNIIARSTTASIENRQLAARLLSCYVPKLEFGDNIIHEHAEVDGAGRSFLEGYKEWLDRVIRESYHILDVYHLSVEEFTHPLDGRAHATRPIGWSSTPLQSADALGERRRNAGCQASAFPCRDGGLKEYLVVDELVLYAPERERSYSLNRTAKAIWDLCDGRHSLAEISGALWQHLEVPDPDVLPHLLSDVEEAVAEFQRLGLLVPPERSAWVTES